LNRNENESYISFIKRVVASVKNGVIDYDEMGDSLLGDKNNYSRDNIRKAFYFLYKLCDFIEDDYEYTEDDMLKEIERLKFDVQKERKKLQTVNSVYQENARLEGRYELYLETILDAVKNLKPTYIPDTKINNKECKDGIGCLVISDAHYGRDVEINDLNGNIINKYNPEEFENRMWLLLEKIKEDRKYGMYNTMVIFDCGDSIEGILRSGSSLINLKKGNIDSAIEYARFISSWLCVLSKRLGMPIQYALTGGNHDILRLLDSRPQFENENIAKMIVEIIQTRVECEKANDDSIMVTVKDYSPIYYDTFYDTNVMAYHGQSKNMKKDVMFFENLYSVKIDILFGGHFHTKQEESIGIASFGDKEVIRVPSLCGIDDYSIKIRESSRAGAKFVNFTEHGKDYEKIFWLN
jgi:hypothetical protein